MGCGTGLDWQGIRGRQGHGIQRGHQQCQEEGAFEPGEKAIHQQAGFSITQPDVNVGAMHRRVAARGPARAYLQECRVVNGSDINVAGGHGGSLHLGMAPQAQVRVIFDQQLFIDGSVRVVADGTAFMHRLVFKNEGPRLVLMASGAVFILPGHGKAPGGLKNVLAVRVVALHAIHETLRHGMMLGQTEFALDIQVAFQAGIRFFTRVYN